MVLTVHVLRQLWSLWEPGWRLTAKEFKISSVLFIMGNSSVILGRFLKSLMLYQSVECFITELP